MSFEYKVVPAPTRGKKAKGVKSAADRFAHALSEVMNALAAEGWEYLRTDTLPAEERHGLTGRTTVFQNMLVFRRSISANTETAASGAEQIELKGDAPNIFIDDHAGASAPKLPSAEAAQQVKAQVAAPDVKDAPRDLAAE